MSIDAQNEVVEGLRAQISALDAELVELVNRRLELVTTLWEHKREHGLPLRVPEREQWLIEHLLAGNRGPLSEDGLRRLHQTLLELTKSEVQ